MKVRGEVWIVLSLVFTILACTWFEISPVRKMMDWRATRNTQGKSAVSASMYQVYDHSHGTGPSISVDFLKGEHFWNPQVAIWLEDSVGNYLQTLLVTTSTARGLFYSGRSATNFKESDDAKADEDTPTRRVDALPYWSHKRNHRYADGFYSPPPNEPLPDAITAATPRENFYFRSSANSVEDLNTVRVMLEVNVAFDENEYYSEYDFVEDSLYHGGTGLLGQPSLVYGVEIHKSDIQRYYIMSLLGHGHHSGASGDLNADLNTITTAKHIVERIVVGVSEGWHK